MGPGSLSSVDTSTSVDYPASFHAISSLAAASEIPNRNTDNKSQRKSKGNNRIQWNPWDRRFEEELSEQGAKQFRFELGLKTMAEWRENNLFLDPQDPWNPLKVHFEKLSKQEARQNRFEFGHPKDRAEGCENKSKMSSYDQSSSDPVQKYGWQVGAEKFLWGKEPAPTNKLTKKRSLGDGRFGKVEEVIAQGGKATMVRKRFFVPHFREKRAKAQIKRIEGEITILKRLSHPHIVTIIGCYQEEESAKHLTIYALMQPVGDGDLKTFLEDQSTDIQHEVRKECIMKWFVCLTSALAYMHSQRVHHEDIKPSNIIYRGNDIFFTDFSSSRHLEAEDETSTTSEAIATRLFAAPEAFRGDNGEIVSHGSKTDVFSLGLVFAELLVVFIRKRIETFRNHVFKDYKSSSKQYHRVSPKFKDFFTKSYATTDDCSALAIYSQYFEHMLRKERKDRPSAKSILANMKKRGFFEIVLGCDCTHENEEMDASDHDSDWEYLEV